jgi:hypothetical protein
LQIRFGIAKELTQGTIRLQPAAVESEETNANHGVVKGAPKSGLALLARFLCAFALECQRGFIAEQL